MKSRFTLQSTVAAVATLCLPLAGQVAEAPRAEEIPRCQKVAESVRASVEKEPQKVLVIVEDAMVANENCACEIVKAAIVASNANQELARQIALTATHIAPRMATVIAECVAAVTRGRSSSGGKEVVESVKQAIGVQPESVLPGGEAGSDYLLMPADIRGVYLIHPSTGGTITTPPEEKTPDTGTKIVVKRVPPRRSTPQSPSVALGP